MPTKRTNAEIALLLRILDDAYAGKGWHGPTLRASVRKVDARQAAWRPAPGRHNIAEIAVHAAYWKYCVRRRLRGEKRGSFPLKGSNWFKLPADLTTPTVISAATERAAKERAAKERAATVRERSTQWRDYVRLLDDQHRQLRDAVAALPPSRLGEVLPGSKIDNAKIIYGIAAHDVYHTGQIRLLKARYAGEQE